MNLLTAYSLLLHSSVSLKLFFSDSLIFLALITGFKNKQTKKNLSICKLALLPL